MFLRKESNIALINITSFFFLGIHTKIVNYSLNDQRFTSKRWFQIVIMSTVFLAGLTEWYISTSQHPSRGQNEPQEWAA